MASAQITTEVYQKGPQHVSEGSVQIAEEIISALREGRGSLIGRHGTVELTNVLLFNQFGKIDLQRTAELELNAGIFPRTEASVSAWLAEYCAAAGDANIMAAGWYAPLAKAEVAYLSKLNQNCRIVPLRSLEPYYSAPLHWSLALKGQKVCVVSSFANTMRQQVPILGDVWPEGEIIPSDVEWSFVRSYYSPALTEGFADWPNGIRSWSEVVAFLEEEVLKTDAKIVLIGCGGLAMPLARRLKAVGKIVIVMGGAIQLLFGIRGARWETHSVISQFFTDAWVYPSKAETPGGARRIEGGCYW
jgi:hypothetical protein